ncbi:glycosyltransferase involved in cell wall biosynthesis [Nocardiopsis sp. Huas11]|uniref:glycosyltransferase family 4 protein n=1 Tax=Nocardiopsis sp. Huas11 TaxID=2183912 RepID=UPI000EB558AC|nr:glycosyltransferase family 4 protein [Nocardiopsis sp. Huas11]RKS04687.1 glycosyltransferase involved in cell wall biosynthesis [Nocardiopsis sp. Huas11]
MKIAFVIANGYGMGGTIRTVYNLAEGLSARHEVEIVSLVRNRKKPFFPVPEGVGLRGLAWTGEPGQGVSSARLGLVGRLAIRHGTAALIGETEARRENFYPPTALGALRRYLRRTDADVVIGTRPGINLLLSRWAPERVLAIAQEHVNLADHSEELRGQIERAYSRLDGMTVLTEADRAAYRGFLEMPSDWLTALPNPLPDRDYPRSAHDNPIIVGAGRMAPVKQYPKLVEAFAVVAGKHPDWRLRIYGGGSKDGALRRKITELGLNNQVTLMGRTKDLTGELAKASLLAVSSRVEGFGMTIVEGFSVGVPAVSFDCPHGPREIIADGQDGLLVPDQDVDALAAAMLRLVEDRDERMRMGREAVKSAGRYAMEPIVRQWEEFIEQRSAAAGARDGSRARRRG